MSILALQATLQDVALPALRDLPPGVETSQPCSLSSPRPHLLTLEDWSTLLTFLPCPRLPAPLTRPEGTTASMFRPMVSTCGPPTADTSWRSCRHIRCRMCGWWWSPTASASWWVAGGWLGGWLGEGGFLLLHLRICECPPPAAHHHSAAPRTTCSPQCHRAWVTWALAAWASGVLG